MIPPPPHPPAGGEGGGGPSNPSWAELRRAVGRVGVTLCHPPPQFPPTLPPKPPPPVARDSVRACVWRCAGRGRGIGEGRGCSWMCREEMCLSCTVAVQPGGQLGRFPI
jgi:hypothetical protein